MKRIRYAGGTLLELLVVTMILGIMITAFVPNFVSARRNANNAVAQAYAHNVAFWLASAEASNEQIVPGSLIGSCLSNELQEEGAPGVLPMQSVVKCGIQYVDNHYTVTVTSTNGRGGPNNDGIFTAFY